MAGNKIEMDPQTLRSTAKKVENSAADVRKELKRFQTVIEGLGSTWSSEVKDRFLQTTRRTGRLLPKWQTSMQRRQKVCSGLQMS